MKTDTLAFILCTILFTAILYILFDSVKPVHAQESPTLIGCINTETRKTVPMSSTGNCFLGKNWQNIGIPPKSQMDELKKLNNKAEIINRLPIYNFESYFDENAGNNIAHGYVQTKRSYNIPKYLIDQVRWLNTRIESQKKGNCSHNKTEDNIIKCIYARHFGALTKDHWYVKKAFAAREFYKWYYSKNPF